MAATPPKPKRNRACISFKTKMEIIRRVSAGETASAVSRYYQINESTIRTILKNANKIKSTVAHVNPLSASYTSRLRSPIVMKMEKELTEWIELQEENSISVTTVAIREKALSIYRDLQKETGSKEIFAASKGWYHKFSLRYRHFNSKKAQMDDPILSSLFYDELKKTISDRGYNHEQIFNIHDTFIFWKRMPSRAYNTTAEPQLNTASARERTTVILCNNITGTFKGKPLLIYPSNNKRLKDNHPFPAYVTSNRRGHLTARIFEDWYHNCFCNEVEEHCRKNQMDFKGLLILNNSTFYPAHLNNLHANIKVLFLPSDITLAIQPMHQSIALEFKLQYLRLLFSQIISASAKRGETKVSRFLSTYNIYLAIGNIISAWSDTEVSTMNNLWEMLAKECICYVTASMECANNSEKIVEIVRLCRDIGGEGFDDVQESDIVELLESVDNSKYNNDMDIENEPEEFVECKPDIMDFSKLFSLGEQMITEAISFDPNTERSTNFAKEIKAALAVYKDAYI